MSATPTDHEPPIPAPFDHRRYVPILLTRQGERHALRVLRPQVRTALHPLFVVHPVAKDPRTGIAKASVEAHLDKLAQQLAKDWGTQPAFVDLRWIDTSRPMSDGSHAIERFLSLANSFGLKLAPAISTTHPASYRQSAIAAANSAGTTLCLRLAPTEWNDLGSPVGSGRLEGLLNETGRPAADIHVILDLEDQITVTTAIVLAAVRSALQNIPHAHDWASLTVAATGMPVGTQDVGRNGAAELPRLEWELWQLLNGSDYRRPSFGDYAVQHPDPRSEFNPLYMDSSAQLRYTISQDWFVARGSGVRRTGNDQIRNLANQVMAHPEFSGAGFSWGDDWISDCASGTCPSGSQVVWRKVTTNHHLTYVVNQLASLVGP